MRYSIKCIGGCCRVKLDVLLATLKEEVGGLIRNRDTGWTSVSSARGGCCR